MMRRFIRRNERRIEWGLGVAAVILPSLLWLSRTKLSDLTLYDVFPPLGLVAFGLMWTHFVMGALGRYASIERKAGGAYMTISMGMVLALILLHPGLFWLALYLDGYGLPPASYMQVYASQLGFLTLGIIGLTIFLSYELKRFFGRKRWWRYVEWAQVIGMAAIFFHAIGVGGDIRGSWFLIIWVLYGLTLAAAVAYSRFIYKSKEGIHATES